jgi:hypothetical protein
MDPYQQTQNLMIFYFLFLLDLVNEYIYSIGWGYGNERIISLDQYEQKKVKANKRPKNLMLTRKAREDLLLEWGISFHDIIDSIRTNVKVKNQRRRTVNAIGTYDRWEEVMETASRKIKRTLLLKSKKDDIAPLLPKKVTRKGDDHNDRNLKPNTRNRSSDSRCGDQSECQQTNYSGESPSKGSAGTWPSKASGQVIGRFSSHSGSNVSKASKNRYAAQAPSEPQRDVNAAPISEIRFSVLTPITTTRYGYDTNPSEDASIDIGHIPMKEYDDNVDEDITISSQDFFPEDEISEALPGGGSNSTSAAGGGGGGNNFYLRAMEDPRFLEAMDDPGAFYNSEDFDNMTTCTPMSQFTYGVDVDDDDDEDEDDDDDDQHADTSYWNIRHSGQQDTPALRRRSDPAVVSDDDDDDDDDDDVDTNQQRWSERLARQQRLDC